MTLYLETSFVFTALVKQEKALTSLIDRSKKIVTSVLTIMETQRGLIRLEKMREINATQRQKFMAALREASVDWNLMEITAEVQSRASETFPVEPIRTLDALHLATALEFLKNDPDLKVAVLDKRVIQNLDPLGIPLAQ